MNNGVLKEFLKYVFLNILGMAGVSCYILADTFFVARGVGEAGLAALNIAVPIYSFISGTGLMIGIGGATRFSVLKTGGKDKAANGVFTSSVVAALIFSALFMTAGLVFSKKIVLLLGANEEIFDMTNTYLKIMLVFSPAFILNQVFICFVRNDKNPSLAMAAMVSGSLFNIVFDYILIFPFKMGILGAVLATVFSPVVGMLILSLHIIKKKNSFHFFGDFSFFKNLAKISALGVPSLISELSSGIVIIIFNIIILRLMGNTGVAAYAIAANIYLVAVSVFNGISQGAQPLLSKAYGCESLEELKKITKYSAITVAVFSVIIYLVIFLFNGDIVAAFNGEKNAELQKIAEEGMILYFLALPFMGANIMLSMLFTSVEKPVPAQIITILRGFALVVPITFIMSYLFKMQGVWLSLTIAEAAVFAVSVCLYKKFKR